MNFPSPKQMLICYFSNLLIVMVSNKDFFIKIIYFIEAQLIYNFVLISTVQQSDSVIYTFSFIIFSTMAYHRILNIVLCDIQQDLSVYPFYTCQFASTNPKLPIHLSSILSTLLGNHASVLFVCEFVLTRISALTFGNFIHHY